MHLHPASLVEPGGMTKVPVWVRDRLSPAKERKRQWKVCLHPHVEQGGMPPMEGSKGASHCFFLSYKGEVLKVTDSHPWIAS